MEDFKKIIKEVQYYKSKIQGISINIEDKDPNFVYLIHYTSLDHEDILDVFKNGLAYSGNEIWRTFRNLSQEWPDRNNFWKRKADSTSIEQMIIEGFSTGFQCFLYKIPLVFFQPVGLEFYPIPIWYYDKTYQLKYNISSSRVLYDMSQKEVKYFRIYPSLLLGYYDLKSNMFYENSNYSCCVNNCHGIYDRQQLFFLYKFYEDEDFWTHNECILNEEQSPYEEMIDKICNNFINQHNKEYGKLKKIHR